MGFRCVPSAADRGVKYAARKRTVATAPVRPTSAGYDWRLYGVLFDTVKFG